VELKMATAAENYSKYNPLTALNRIIGCSAFYFQRSGTKKSRATQTRRARKPAKNQKPALCLTFPGHQNAASAKPDGKAMGVFKS